jgi:hypothetical protein
MSVLGALISAIAGLLLSREHPRAKSLLVVLVCLGASVSAFGGLWGSYEQDKSSRVLHEKTNKINDLSEKLVAKSDEIAELNKKLVEKSDELATTFHGGDSFVYLDPRFMSRHIPEDNLVSVGLFHKGKYPIYDVEIRVVDIQKLKQVFAEIHKRNSGPTYEEIAHTEIHYSFRNNTYLQRFDPNRYLMRLDIWQLPKDTDQQDYNVWISARNGEVVQQIRFRRINGEWKCQMRVNRGNEVLYDTTLLGADYLPRNEAGEVQWE